jgi:ribosomal protein S6--L-glutamate ligase
MIIKGTVALKKHYHELGTGDTVSGIISDKTQTPIMLIDLLERGVCCLPSPLAQVLNGSKVAQARIFNDVMLPHTLAITRRTDLIQAITYYNRHKIKQLITKEDHMHCGHGIRSWENIEMLYSFLGVASDAYPIVIQPLADSFTDVRVIMAGGYQEAYVRRNPHNLRQNLAVGGTSQPFGLNPEIADFCREVMARGKFPYAHIDLMVFGDGTCYLSEIALNGGIKGAAINRQDLEQIKDSIIEKLIQEHDNQQP